jgi:hypothetical protein
MGAKVGLMQRVDKTCGAGLGNQVGEVDRATGKSMGEGQPKFKRMGKTDAATCEAWP